MRSIPVAICTFSDNNFQQLKLKKKTILLIFYCISEICMKFRTFCEKKEYPGLIITDIIGSETDIYLSV